MQTESRDAAFAAPYGPDITRPVLMALDRFAARKVLDLACGQGWMTDALARCGFDAEGLDADPARITSARLAYPELKFHLAGPPGSPPLEVPGGFDAAVGLQLRAAMAPTDRLLQTALKLLRPGGLLLLTVPRQGSLTAVGTLSAWLQRLGYERPQVEALGFVAPVARTLLLTAHRPLG